MPSDKPFRDRVEVLALDDDGKVFGSLYPNGGFGGYGGGIEDGETAVEAAEREFMEESGRKVSNVRILPIPPVEIEWSESDGGGSAEKKARRAKYKGSRTVYAVADLGLPDSSVKPEKDRHGRKRGSLFSLDDAIASLDDGEGEFAAVNAARKKALERLRSVAVPEAVEKLSAAFRLPRFKFPRALGVPALGVGAVGGAAGLASLMTRGKPEDSLPVPNALVRGTKSVADILPRLSGP